MVDITGTAVDSSGTLLDVGTLQLQWRSSVVVSDPPATIFPEPVTVEIGASGVLDFTLNPGLYDGVYRTDPQSNGVTFTLWVPNRASASFNECLNGFN